MIPLFKYLIKKNYQIATYICTFIVLVCCKFENNLPDPLEAGWNNEAVCEVIEDNKEVRVLQCTFAPGVGHEKHYHKPHFGYTIAGSRFRIKDTSGTREVNVPTGYSFSKTETSVHEVLNIGDSTAVFLIIEYK